MWNAVFWVLRSGAAWRDVPDRHGPWGSAYSHFIASVRRLVLRLPTAFPYREGWRALALKSGAVPG